MSKAPGHRATRDPVFAIVASSIGTQPPGSLAIPARLIQTVGSVREDTGGFRYVGPVPLEAAPR